MTYEIFFIGIEKGEEMREEGIEVWLPVKDFDNYEVSSKGRVRNSKTGRILKTQINDRGYEHLSLRKDKKQVEQRVHRLVAETFYYGDHDDLDVNHIDGNKRNNFIGNLEFCTRQENIRHAFDNGLKKPSRMKSIKVIETGEIFDSIRECGRALGCNQSDICKCLNGKATHCQGYHFELL